MARKCQVTGKKPGVGNLLSHSHRKTRRRFDINLFRKRFWLDEEKRWVRLRVSAHGMKVIARQGIAAVVRSLREQGVKV
jgi:large subunit ribosomal protein L28